MSFNGLQPVRRPLRYQMPWSQDDKKQLERLWQDCDLTRADIAAKLGRTAAAIQTQASLLGLGMRPDTRMARFARYDQYVIPPSSKPALIAAADKRQISVANLCRLLLEVIADNALVDAILDDMGDRR